MRVVLAVPPFGPVQYPVLGPSLLKARLREAGFDCQVAYLLFDFARRIGFDEYVRVYHSDPPLLVGERLFAPALFGEAVPSIEQYWQDVVLPFVEPLDARIRVGSLYEERLKVLRRIEQDASEFVAEAAEHPALVSADVVGFSSTFAQHSASLAIAKRLKECHPEKQVVFGGANCFDEMGEQTLASFPFVDWVFTGEADVALPEFLAALAAGRAPDVPGVLGRNDAAGPRPAQRVALDALPTPDFDDFFAAYADCPAERARVLAVPVEGARGCWWGEKNHCVFCGIGEEQMPFRRKSAERLRSEIETLVERYGVEDVWAADYILDPAAFEDLIPQLAEQRAHRELFFEVKANLTHQQLVALAQAGITRIQPGIESLDDSVLRLMRKGTTAWQNVQLLKWSHEFGIALQWNLLCGFPGEDPEAYAQMAKLLPQLVHLPPPKACSQITVDRFSPLFRDAVALGMEVEPARAYRHVYALGSDAIRGLAYFHSHRSPGGLDTRKTVAVPAYAEAVAQQVRLWQRLHDQVRFEYETRADALELVDTRPGGSSAERVLEGVDRDVFLALEAARGPRGLREALDARGAHYAPERVKESVERLVEQRIVAILGSRHLALATRRPPGGSGAP